MKVAQGQENTFRILYISKCMVLTIIILFYSYNLQIKAQQLAYSNFFANFTYENDWIIQGGLGGQSSICNSSKIFGGYYIFGRNTNIIKSISLQPHYKINLSFKFWHIDNWGNEYLEVRIDGILVHNFPYNSECTKSSICGHGGGCWGDGVDQVQIVMNHTNLNIELQITGRESFWGISELNLWINWCPDGCNICFIQNNFKQQHFIQQLNYKVVQITDIFLDNLIILTYSSCIEQQKMKQLEDYVKKEFNLKDHNIVCLSIKQISTITNPFIITIYFENDLVLSTQSANQVSSELDCNLQVLNESYTIQFQNKQSNLNIKVEAIWKIQQSSQMYIGEDFSLFLIPLSYQNCLDQNKDPFDGCFSFIYDCVQGCDQCIKGICIECQKGWQYQIESQTCLPICGDQIIMYNEECDDGNQINYDGCFNCKFTCPLFCDKCQFGICLQWQKNYEIININCEIGDKSLSLQMLHDFYINLDKIWQYDNYYNEYFIQHIYKLLHSQFHNEFQHHASDCNLKNMDIFGQFYQQFTTKSIQNCLSSLFDQCLECSTFYKLSQNKKNCIPICDDGIMIDFEICDDKNNIQFDGCYKCEQNCQLQCKHCLESKCYSCIDGWQLINFICYDICGDGQLAISSSEQCDDGNYNPNDGCYNCKFECDENCFSCAYKGICLFCQENFQMNEKNACIPTCGDGIIIEGLEDCEDLNNIPYDGCHQCLFQCEMNCYKCREGICQECIDGYELRVEGCYKLLILDQDDLENSQKQQCGDGIRQNLEQCDDSNTNSLDCCSKECKIEENCYCNTDNPSICFQKTTFTLQYLNQTQRHQYVQLSFSNEVKQTSDIAFTEQIQSEILNLSLDKYEITIYPIVNVYQTNFTKALFEFDIVILEQMTAKANLSISINSQLIDQNEIPVDLSSKSILLLQPQIINQDQINVAIRFQQFGNAIIIGLGVISVFMLLFGNPQQSIEILDILQFQSYLKFINVMYPENVNIYFQSSDIVTISPILINLKITDLLDKVISNSFVESIGKLQKHGLNADLLTNISSQISQIAFFFLLYVFLQYYAKFFKKYCFTSKHFYYIRESRSKWVEIIVIKFYFLNKKFQNLKTLYNKKGLRQLFYANCWDILFKVFLYLKSYTNVQLGYRSIISYCICSLTMIFVTLLLCLQFKGLSRNVDFTKLRIEQHEGIILFKKLLFIYLLINFQNQDIMQCAMISLLTLGYIGLILTKDFKIQKLELTSVILAEVPVMIFTLTSLVYCSDFFQILAFNHQVLLGFIQIGVLIFGLFGPIIIFGSKIYKELYQYYIKRKEQKKKLTLNQIIGFSFQNY